jgi:predicted ester cyclase
MAANIATRLNFDEEETKAFHGMAIAKKMLSLFYLLKYQIWQTEKQEKLYEKQLTNS